MPTFATTQNMTREGMIEDARLLVAAGWEAVRFVPSGQDSDRPFDPRAHHVDMMPHNPLGSICTAATVHFAAAVPNFAWMETRAAPTEAAAPDFDGWALFPAQVALDGAV